MSGLGWRDNEQSVGLVERRRRRRRQSCLHRVRIMVHRADADVTGVSPVELTDRFHSGHSRDDNGDFIKIDCPAIYERATCEGPRGAPRDDRPARFDYVDNICSPKMRNDLTRRGRL